MHRLIKRDEAASESRVPHTLCSGSELHLTTRIRRPTSRPPQILAEVTQRTEEAEGIKDQVEKVRDKAQALVDDIAKDKVDAWAQGRTHVRDSLDSS